MFCKIRLYRRFGNLYLYNSRRFFMQLTLFTDYGLRILMYLSALPEERSASIDEVSRVFDLSRNHINKIVHLLGREKFIATQRGKGGGIKLGRPPQDIRLGAVIRKLETSLQAVNCESPAPCALLPVCRLRGILADAMNAFMAECDRYTLADLVAKEQIIKVLKIA
jgi:Rrf2 family transcriptional regulator, nitric oxide-sensitive transcriptional repressor